MWLQASYQPKKEWNTDEPLLGPALYSSSKYLVALPITSPLARSLRIQSRRVPILPSSWHHVSISTTSPLQATELTVRIKPYQKRKRMEIKVQCKLEKLPSRVLVDLNVHSVRHPNKSEFSHCSGRGKTISGEPNALGMVTSYLLYLRECLPLKKWYRK